MKLRERFLLVISCVFILICQVRCQLLHLKPKGPEWVKSTGPRNLLADWLVEGCWTKDQTQCAPAETFRGPREYEGYDGWYNNIARPDLGAIDTPLLRRWPAAYEDGTYQPAGSNRPNPLILSDQLLKGEIGTSSRTGRNALVVFFGQQVVEEILDAQRPACPPEYFNIDIPPNHPYRKALNHKEMPILRTRFDVKTGLNPNNPRQQLNEITPYLDGGLIYGTTKAWSDILRTDFSGKINEDGLLAHSADGLFPEINKIRMPLANPPPPFHHAEMVANHELKNVDRFFKLGNPRGNENPFLLAFGILWFRWHNYLARNIKRKHPTWNGEKVFNEARKWVIATQQSVVVYEWLPSWLGKELTPYTKYNPGIDPQIDQFFQSAAFRFGHTLVPPGVYLRRYGREGCSTVPPTAWKNNAVRTCNNFWRPQDSILIKVSEGNDSVVDIDRLLMGMALQLSEAEDHIIVEDLRGSVFGPLEFSRRDLMAINVQRGRDHGLPDYNTAREAYGLNRIEVGDVPRHFNWTTSTIRDKLLELYKNDMNNIDVWIGGILETGDGPGELFTTIIQDQFERIRDGDRFWFENTANRMFSPAEIGRIKRLTLYDIIMAVTKMEYNDIQTKVFRVPATVRDLHPECAGILITKQCVDRGIQSNCFFLPILNKQTLNEECTPPATYDYFSGSHISFILSFIALGTWIVGLGGVVWILAKQNEKKRALLAKQLELKLTSTFISNSKENFTPFAAEQWEGPGKLPMSVLVILNTDRHQVQILNQSGELLRGIDVKPNKKMEMFIVSDGIHFQLRIEHEYDLVIKFDSEFLRKQFLDAFEGFVTALGLSRERITNISLKAILKTAVTKQDRQKRLERFFRVVFSQAFQINHSVDEILSIDSLAAREVIYTELTLMEFAEALSMRPDSEFVKKMFELIDVDKNGFISFREFVDMLVIFAKGTADQKAKLMFDMYDINGTGLLTLEDFIYMIKSLMETVNAQANAEELENTVQAMLAGAGLQDKDAISFDDFLQILANDKDKLNYAQLDFSGIAPGTENFVIKKARETFDSIYADPQELRSRVGGEFHGETEDVPLESKTIDSNSQLIKSPKIPSETSHLYKINQYLSNYSRQLFWVILYTLVLLAIFAERAYYYTVEREHSGLRRIAGYGVTVTRGAASAMMFTYSSLLITMCRNTITMLRDTKLHVYIPFDSAVDMHKYIACWALFFTLVHIIGHGFNFYHISTQTADDLTCLFRNYFHATHELPKFHYWLWQTMTGITGVILTIICAAMYLFAIPYVRRRLYNLFWLTHSLYPLFYIFMILHGTGRLIQSPIFWYFFVGPITLFTVDTCYSLSRKKVQITVVRAELLPSDVTLLEFKKPSSFVYKSGQWVRIACLGHSAREYHPFTISSSPNEPNLSVHIRAVGPWTKNIRLLYNKNLLEEKSYPRIYLDGPFGEAHQDWYQYDVAVLIGGGIGVTPFASILKDIVHRGNNRDSMRNSKVYFLWVTRTQRQFEWLVDIIREVENTDERRLVSVHLFITQFYQKFDLRTILLYICERHFQRTANKSLFSGLRAVTHFGRPNFMQFFKALQMLHTNTPKIGVFSCGPPPMTQSVEQASISVNTNTVDGPLFQHHYKNF